MEQQETAKPDSSERTDLAYYRSRWAAERTLMAWIRTAISMVTFGVAFDRFFAYLPVEGKLRESDPTSRWFGMLLVASGVLLLLVAVIEHVRILGRLKRHLPLLGGPFSLPLLGAAMVLLIGMAALVFGIARPH